MGRYMKGRMGRCKEREAAMRGRYDFPSYVQIWDDLFIIRNKVFRIFDHFHKRNIVVCPSLHTLYVVSVACRVISHLGEH